MPPPDQGNQPSMRPQATGFPAKIKCGVGGEWKDPAQFSKRQLQVYMTNLRTKKNVTPAQSGIACRIHTGEQIHELQCDGPCNKWQPLQYFSKSSRTLRGRTWCLACTEWSETNQPGEAPYAAPMADRSPDEHDNNRPSQSGGLGDTVIFDQDDQAGHSVSASSDFGGNGSGGYLVSRLGDDSAQRLDNQSEPSASTGNIGRGASPHRSTRSGQSGASYGSTADTVTAAYAASEKSANPTTLPLRRPQRPPQEFNAYGPNGEVVRMTKAPTVFSERTSTSATGTAVVAKSGWARLQQRKTPIAPPEYLRDVQFQPKTPPSPNAQAAEKALDYSDDGESEDEC